MMKKTTTAKAVNISARLKGLLPREVIRFFKLIDRIAQQNSCTVFLVGGLIRDILLGVRNLDLDILVEGDTPRLVKALVKEAGGSYVLHKRFGTAVVTLPWPVRFKSTRLASVKIDFATARKEIYKSPAALPEVAFSTVREDLFRRDFTINAMAASLMHKNFGQLIDFFNGQADLAGKKIRVLHDKSFLDDPTRIFRAVRFEQRFNFKIEPHTERLIKEALKNKMIEKTSKARLKDELILILKEKDPGKALSRMENLVDFGFIHPKAHFTKGQEQLFSSISKTIAWFKSVCEENATDIWLVYMMALLGDLDMGDLENVCREFAFTKTERTRLCSYRKNNLEVAKFLGQSKRLSPSEIFRQLKPFSDEAILCIMAGSNSKYIKRHIASFLLKYNKVSLKISGKDLAGLGLKAGPEFKKILTAALYAKLDKGFRHKKQELDFIKRFLAGHK